MKTIKDKQILIGADFAGYLLKEAVAAHLKKKGWTVTDVGVRSPEDTDTDLMFHRVGSLIADAYLNASLGSGYEWWKNFYEFHKLAIDELETFDYEEYKKNGFKVKHIADYDLVLEDKPDSVK